MSVLSRARIAVFTLAMCLGGMSAAHADGEPAWLGVAMEARAGAVIVTHVISGSPADRAGIRAGDRIERVDGAQVAAAAEVQRLVAEHHSGDLIDVKIARASNETNITVKAVPRPTMDEILRMDHVGKAAPTWVGVAAASRGAPVSIAALRGRVALVEFWAISCGPCRMSGPELARLQSRFGAQGLAVVGITMDAKSDAAEFAERTSLGFSVVADENGDTSRAYGIAALPTLFVVDKRGIVRDVTVGYAPENFARVETLAQKLLAEPNAP